jgi:hypothetical protein
MTQSQINTLLPIIAQHESSGNYQATISPQTCAQVFGMTKCTASGAYGIIDQTWAEATSALGITGYPTAASAPSDVQDQVAAYLLQTRGTSPWAWLGSSAPASTGGPVLDVSGDAAATSTADLLNQLTSGTLDLSTIDPTTAVFLAIGAAAVIWAVAS